MWESDRFATKGILDIRYAAHCVDELRTPRENRATAFRRVQHLLDVRHNTCDVRRDKRILYVKVAISYDTLVKI